MKGISLHIGLNRVSSSHYGGPKLLIASENDAEDMRDIATSRSFASTLLLSERATTTAVQLSLTSAAQQLRAGDIFLLTYSGHGGLVGDTNGDELHGFDQTWCLYDREFVDDELYAHLAGFRQGVRILIVSHSCHSGSIATLRLLSQPGIGNDEDSVRSAKALSFEESLRVYEAHREVYDSIQDLAPLGRAAPLEASVILLSACQDAETTFDGDRNGTFTEALRNVWNSGTFSGTYLQFHDQIRVNPALDKRQHPNYSRIGTSDAAFDMQRPFTI